MSKKRSILDGATMADERLQYALNGIKKQLASQQTGVTRTGTTSYPTPYFGPAGTTYWRPDNATVASVTLPDGSSQAVDDLNKGTDEDNEDGGALVTWWLIPSDCAILHFNLRAVKKNGQYGRVIPFEFADIDDTERAAGFCERTVRGLRPTRVYDVVRAVSLNDAGVKTTNPVSPFKAPRVVPQLAGGVTRDSSMLAWPNPLDPAPIGYAPYGTSPHFPQYVEQVLDTAVFGEALARLDLRNYGVLNVRITAVGAPEKEKDGTFYPVTVTFAAGQVDRIVLRGFRVGRKPEDYSLYGKTYRRWPFELSATDRDAGTAILRVGPFGVRQAKQPWHITRIHAVDFKDEVQRTKYNELYPALVGNCAGPADIGIDFAASPSTDLDSAYHKARSNSEVSSGRVPGAGADGSVTADTDDVSAGQATNWQNAQTSDGTAPSDGGANGKRRVLAVLAPGEAVDGMLAGFVVTTAPDLATEKDSDAYIRFSADIQTPAAAASTAGDANATEAIFIFHRQGDADSRANYIRKRVALNPTDAKAELTFHRKVGRKFKMKKMRLRNGISKVDTTLSAQTGGGLTSGVFVAGATGGAYTDTDAHTGIGSVTLSDADSSNAESNKAHIKASIVNNGVSSLPVIPKRLQIYLSRRGVTSDPGAIPADDPTSGDWRLEKELALGDEPNLATIATVTRTFSIKLRRKKQHWIRARLYVKGSSTPTDSSSLSYTADSELPVGNYAHGNNNLIRGGNLSSSELERIAGGSDSKPAKRWCTVSAAAPTGAPSALTDIDTGTGDDAFWDKAGAYIQMKGATANVTVLTKCRRNIKAGDRLSFSWKRRSPSGTTVDQDYQATLYHVSSSDGVTYTWTSIATFDTVTDVDELSTDWSLTYTRGDVATFTKARYSQIWFALKRTSTGATRMTDFMLVRGNQPMTHDISPEEADWGDNGDDAGIASVTYDSVASSAGDFDQQSGGNRDSPGALDL